MKADTKGHALYDSIYLKCSEEANPETENRLVVATQGEVGIRSN